jgi:hypothetical protein
MQKNHRKRKQRKRRGRGRGKKQSNQAMRKKQVCEPRIHKKTEIPFDLLSCSPFSFSQTSVD